MIKQFNLRVYGLIIHDGAVLVSNEKRFGMEMIKFPGGGLEKGEGIADCVLREFKEELGIEIMLGKLFYVNDFLQVSAFNEEDQLISFYYLVHPIKKIGLDKELWLDNIHAEENQEFYWVAISEIDASDFTFPVDQKVVYALRENKT